MSATKILWGQITVVFLIVLLIGVAAHLAIAATRIRHCFDANAALTCRSCQGVNYAQTKNGCR
jgi:hypothetical protein